MAVVILLDSEKRIIHLSNTIFGSKQDTHVTSESPPTGLHRLHSFVAIAKARRQGCFLRIRRTKELPQSLVTRSARFGDLRTTNAHSRDLKSSRIPAPSELDVPLGPAAAAALPVEAPDWVLADGAPGLVKARAGCRCRRAGLGGRAGSRAAACD